jgi:hypothetical protein
MHHRASGCCSLQDCFYMMRAARVREHDEFATLKERNACILAEFSDARVSPHTKRSFVAVRPVVHTRMHHATVGGRCLSANSKYAVDKRYSTSRMLLQQLAYDVNADDAGARNDKIESLSHGYLPLPTKREAAASE